MTPNSVDFHLLSNITGHNRFVKQRQIWWCATAGHTPTPGMCCSVASGGQERYEELMQQERAMAVFMETFATSKAGKVAELEGMQLAGAARLNPFGPTSNPDMTPLAYDESQARARTTLT